MTRPQDAPRNWRKRLDDRIDQCPGCDDWRWDRECRRCNPEGAALTERRKAWLPIDRWLSRREKAA